MDKYILRDLYDLKDGNVHNYLCEQLEKLTKSLISVQDEVVFRQIQGKSQQLLELIELIENADEMLRKLEQSQRDVSKMF